MTYFVKMLGSTDMPMPNDAWGRRTEIATEVRFPAKPPPTDVGPGDELVYYAVGGYKRVFATVRVESEPELDRPHENPVIAKRWPYAADVSLNPTTKLKYVSSGPELSAIGRGLQEQVHQGVSHFEIGHPEFERAVSLLRQAKTVEDQKLKTGWRP